MATLTIIEKGSQRLTHGTVENLSELAATALLKYVPKGVEAKARYVEALRRRMVHAIVPDCACGEGACGEMPGNQLLTQTTLPGIQVVIER